MIKAILFDMDSNFQIEIAKAEDAGGITEVQRTTWLATYPNKDAGISYSDVKEQTDKFNSERIIQKLSNPDVRYWVAKIHGKIAGMLKVSKGDDKNSLEALYVLPEFQGKGIGAALTKIGLEWLGYEKDITLGVVIYNKSAIDFYKKFGFVEGGERHDSVASLPSGKVLPEIEMVLRKKIRNKAKVEI